MKIGIMSDTHGLLREEVIPVTTSVTLNGKKFYVIHNKGKLAEDIPGYDVIVYGHSHKYSLTEKDKKIWFNPGCCGKRKKGQNVIFAIAEINDGEISFTRIDIPNGKEKEELPDNIDTIISKAVKLIDKGKKPETIAGSCKISKELADEICRMYLTHPKIDVQGIIARLTRDNPEILIFLKNML